MLIETDIVLMLPSTLNILQVEKDKRAKKVLIFCLFEYLICIFTDIKKQFQI